MSTSFFSNQNLHRMGIANPMLWVKYAFVGVFLILAMGFIAISVPDYGIWPVAYILVILIYFSLQVWWLIPYYFNERKYTGYALWTLVFSVLFLLTQVKIVSIMSLIPTYYYAKSGGNGIDNDAIGFIFTAVPILIAFSFIFWFVKLMASKNEGLSFLIKEKTINLELLINAILILIPCLSLSFEINHHNGLIYYIEVLITIAIFYAFAFGFVPHYLFTKKYFHFGVFSLLLVISAYFSLRMTEIIQNGSIHNIEFSSIFRSGLDLPELFDMPLPLGFTFFVILATVYAETRRKLVQGGIGFQLLRKKEAEFKQLRQQVNPHFLFNNLNTLYAFALKEKSTKTAESIGKLANLMRFLIDDINKDEIPLKTELKYIQDFIKLQSIRSAVNHDIHIAVSVADDFDYAIAPMLLIPFVENAFKHGMNPNKVSCLVFEATAKNGKMKFRIENSMDDKFKTFYNEKGFGIGIENVKKRLEYAYAESHELIIEEKESAFKVALAIKLEPSK